MAINWQWWQTYCCCCCHRVTNRLLDSGSLERLECRGDDVVDVAELGFATFSTRRSVELCDMSILSADWRSSTFLQQSAMPRSDSSCWWILTSSLLAFSALTLLVVRQEGHPACRTQWWGAGVVICLERGADLHTAQLMPLPLTVSCFSNIQIGFTYLVRVHPGSPGQRAVKRVCVFVCVRHFMLCTYPGTYKSHKLLSAVFKIT